MTTLTFIVQPNGEFPSGIKDTLKRMLGDLAGKKARLMLKEAKEKRSLDQNSYYWGIIVPHVRKVRFEMGDPMSIEAIHEDLLAQFAPTVNSKRMDGATYTRPMRSKEMSVPQMAEYLTAITATMAQFGEPIPIQESVIEKISSQNYYAATNGELVI